LFSFDAIVFPPSVFLTQEWRVDREVWPLPLPPLSSPFFSLRLLLSFLEVANRGTWFRQSGFLLRLLRKSFFCFQIWQWASLCNSPPLDQDLWELCDLPHPMGIAFPPFAGSPHPAGTVLLAYTFSGLKKMLFFHETPGCLLLFALLRSPAYRRALNVSRWRNLPHSRQANLC